MAERRLNRLIAYTAAGSSLEFFDFTIYALFSPYISQTFFPQSDHYAAMLDTFAVFALGYLARPLGALFFGHLGDTRGRRNTVILTVGLMSLSTLTIGLLPGYAVLGIWAPVLLVLFRLLQGISLGGEVTGAAVFVAEHLPPSNRGSGVAWIYAGVTFGNVIASLFGVVLGTWLSHQQMVSWGWRVPFIFGAVLGFISYRLRTVALESPVFRQALECAETTTVPLKILMRNHGRAVIKGIGITALMASSIFTLLYLPAYFSHQLHMSAELGFRYSACNFLLLVASCIGFGYMSDRVGRRQLLIFGSGLMLIIGYPLFALLSEVGGSAIWLFSGLFAIMVGMVNASYACLLVELFPTQVRYSGMSLSYNLAFAIFGGLSPLVNTWLQHIMGSAFSLWYLLAASALLSLVAGLMTQEKLHQAL
ncbi:Proline/betaine transporter [BD1-7 clade bacterium]|uniref:Proline/betaine transporter n=1 Tax=BD1-7 clade bacterium TaxID=2029982 RepID=A0A5S9PFR0_9GAMM|nr:Proline/betaine transporter [BD1-7 clade bacterium]CAA0102909.1 Proline/betaine transporter [BD1-7 clade bacterium]